MEILERTLGFERDSDAFYEEWKSEEDKIADAIVQAQVLLPNVTYTQRDLKVIAELMSEMEVDGHRGDIVILKGALTHAAYQGRDKINTHDILKAAELALPHRLKRQPFQDTESQIQALSDQLESIRQDVEQEVESQMSPEESPAASEEKKTLATK